MPEAKDGVATLETLQASQTELQGTVTALTKGMETMSSNLEKLAQPQYRGGAPAIREGENILSSRQYSFTRLMKAAACTARGDRQYNGHAKIEMELGSKLRKEFGEMMGSSNADFLSEFVAPLSTAMMPESWETDKGEKLPGISVNLVKECRDHFNYRPYADQDELSKLGIVRLQKDVSANSQILGGSLIPLATTGELIEVFRNTLLFERAACRIVPLPPNGAMRYPRQTSSTTVAATSEGAVITESNIGTGAISLGAKPYSGLVDMTEEILKFAGNMSIEAMVRDDLAQVMTRTVDRDRIDGPGGLRMLGLTLHPNILVRLATTVAANGNTLGVRDLPLLFADLLEANAPADESFVYAMRPGLWAQLTTRVDSQGRPIFDYFSANGSGLDTMFKRPVLRSTNIPETRIKGSGTTLSMVMGFVPKEVLIGQSGVIDFATTNSDGTKFQERITTVRATTYTDINIRHDESFGMIDTLLDA